MLLIAERLRSNVCRGLYQRDTREEETRMQNAYMVSNYIVLGSVHWLNAFIGHYSLSMRFCINVIQMEILDGYARLFSYLT